MKHRIASSAVLADGQQAKRGGEKKDVRVIAMGKCFEFNASDWYGEPLWVRCDGDILPGLERVSAPSPREREMASIA